MDKLKMQTADGVQDNISRIAELFPECITEVKNQRGRPSENLIREANN